MLDWIKKGLPHPENLPGNLEALKEEFERQVKAAVQGILAKMDLVTRDELDVQLNVLLRTREKLEALEARLTALETTAKNNAPSAVDPHLTKAPSSPEVNSVLHASAPYPPLHTDTIAKPDPAAPYPDPTLSK